MPQRIARWNPTRQIWELLQVDLFSGLLVPYSETWPTSGTTRDGRAYAHPTRVLPTDDSGSSSSPGLLPTPSAIVANDGEQPETWTARHEYHRTRTDDRPGMRRRTNAGMPLTIAVQLLPTPEAADSSGGRLSAEEGGVRPSGAKRAVTLATAVHHGISLLPTPEAKLGRSGPDYARMGRDGSGGHDLATAVALFESGEGTDPPSSGGSTSPA